MAIIPTPPPAGEPSPVDRDPVDDDELTPEESRRLDEWLAGTRQTLQRPMLGARRPALGERKPERTMRGTVRSGWAPRSRATSRPVCVSRVPRGRRYTLRDMAEQFNAGMDTGEALGRVFADQERAATAEAVNDLWAVWFDGGDQLDTGGER